MTIGVTVSERRKLPLFLDTTQYTCVQIQPGQLREAIGSCDVLYLWNLAYDELRECLLQDKKLPKYIHIARQGKDESLSKLARTKNIEISYADNAFTDSISEFVMASVFMLAKGLHYAAAVPEWKKYPQQRIRGSRALILGAGNIGRACAELLRQNGITVEIAGKPEMNRFAAEGTLFGDTSTALGDIDHIICCLPLNDSTTGLLDKKFFALFDKAHFINISRGQIVATADLLAALDKGQIRSAVLDAFEQEPLPAASPLWHDPRVVVSAHQSYFSPDWEAKLHESFIARLLVVMI
jgi:phosphoglycerate dehydrogenase-like enzyme